MKKILLLLPLAAMAGSCNSDMKEYQYVEGRRDTNSPNMAWDTIAFEAKNDTAAYVEMYKMFMKSSEKRRDEAMKPFICSVLDERDSILFKDIESIESIEFRAEMQERARKELGSK